MRREISVAVLSLSLATCGARPEKLGVLIRTLDVTKVRVAAAPAGIVTQDRWPGTNERFTRADVLGDSRPESLLITNVYQSIDIRDSSGRWLRRIDRGGSITDVGGVPGGDGKDDILIDERGAFTVVDAEGRPRAHWQEPHDPGRFAVAPWKGRPTVFYLLDDSVVLRSPRGELIGYLAAPQAHLFGRPYVAAVGSRTVVVATGNGYTPYHMICVYEPDGTLAFQEMDDELAFAVAPDPAPGAFTVTTRTTVWRYTIP